MHGNSLDGSLDSTANNPSQSSHCSNSAQCDTGGDEVHSDRGPQATPGTFEFKFLYLFSGPKKSSGGVENFCMERGVRCTCIDIEYDSEHNLLDQDFADKLMAELDEYDAFLLSPPCSSFTMARSGNDAGPGPLRGTTGKERYGLPHLSVDDKQKVREGTLLARRAHKVAHHANQSIKPWILEQPHWREDGTSMFMLDEYL